MNRTFKAPLSPARARLLASMAEFSEWQIPSEIVSTAAQDMIPPDVLHQTGIDDPIEASAVQFVLDTNFRCGLPTLLSNGMEQVNRVIAAAIKIGNVVDILYLNDFMRNRQNVELDDILPRRRHLLIMPISLGQDAAPMLGRVFPKIICTGVMMQQFSWLNDVSSTSVQMGKILYPGVVDGMKVTSDKHGTRRANHAMGIFTGMIQPSR